MFKYYCMNICWSSGGYSGHDYLISDFCCANIKGIFFFFFGSEEVNKTYELLSDRLNPHLYPFPATKAHTTTTT